MLSVAAHTHPAAKCPLETPEGKTMIKKLFSDDNVKKSGLKIVGAYVICPKDKSTEQRLLHYRCRQCLNRYKVLWSNDS